LQHSTHVVTQKNSATTEIAREARKMTIHGHSRLSVAVLIDAAYDFLLALNNNLTSMFNRS